MTRAELEKRWVLIVQAVLTAQDTLSDPWDERLRQTVRQNDAKEKQRVADAYTAAMAKEIVSHTSDEEIAEMDE